MLRALCIWLLLIASASGADWYVATTGSASGDGSIGDPWDLLTAIGHDTTPPAGINPGDTIYLRGGTYTGGAQSYLAGTAGNYITIKPYPGETVIHDANGPDNGTSHYFRFYGDYVSVEGIEFTCSDTSTRVSSQSGSSPTDIFIRGGVYIFAGHHRIRNCVIHDVMNNYIHYDAAGSEFYGNIVYNNGWVGSDHAWGQGIYVKNTGTDVTTIGNNIMFCPFEFNVHAYDDTATGRLQYMDFDDNILFEAGAGVGTGYSDQRETLIGGATGTDSNYINYRDNYHWHTKNWGGYVYFGYNYGTASPHQNLVCTDNIFGHINVYWAKSWSPLTVTGNVVHKGDGNDGSWTGTYAPGSGYTAANDPGSGQATYLTANAYDGDRGHLAVYNWSGASTVSVDLSSVVTSGNIFEVYHVYDLDTPVTTGTFNGSSASIPLAATQAPAAIGTGLATPITTPITFGAFLVLDMGAPPINPPGPSTPSGAVAHYKADYGITHTTNNVTQWNDLSGNGNHLNVVDSDPLLVHGGLQNHSYVAFDGNDALSRTASISGPPTGDNDRTIAIVVRFTSNGVGGFAYGNNATSETFGAVVNSTGKARAQKWASDLDGTTTLNGAGWSLLMVDGGSGTWSVWVDGTQENSASVTLATVLPGDGIVVGKEIDGSPFITMDLAEAWIWSKKLSTAEKTQLADYFNRVYITGYTTPLHSPTGN